MSFSVKDCAEHNHTDSLSPHNCSFLFSSSSSAPWYDVPIDEVVSVEHPYIIRNLEKGIESLGGSAGLDRASQLRLQDRAISDFRRSLYVRMATLRQQQVYTSGLEIV